MLDKFFGRVRPKFQTEKCDTPFFLRKNLKKRENFSKTVGFVHKTFDKVRQKIFDRKTWYTLLFLNFFDIPSFLKHWMDAHKFFRHCETKNFRRKIVIPLLCLIFFDYLKISETLKGCLRSFRHCQTWIFRQKNVYAPNMQKKFTIPQFFWNIAGMLNKFFDPVRPNFFNGKMWYPPFLSVKSFWNENVSQKQ